ncbi:unnamed protein product [Microthlaspi erraticum]|uniref:Uncharacterized protein n=1 Tax=Microthlaspi erraticum TaxID=1685480 RepID=A0A6D2KJY9_9BRAS|nr:unnamed protein product [Microthlaspi erraticum]
MLLEFQGGEELYRFPICRESLLREVSELDVVEDVVDVLLNSQLLDGFLVWVAHRHELHPPQDTDALLDPIRSGIIESSMSWPAVSGHFGPTPLGLPFFPL